MRISKLERIKALERALGMKILTPEDEFKQTVRYLYARDCRKHKPLIDPAQLGIEAAAQLGWENDPERWKKLAIAACREHYAATERKYERRQAAREARAKGN